MPGVALAYDILLWGSMIFLSVAVLGCLLRAILGPRFTDRVVSVNIICTKSIIMIALLSFLLDMPALVDIAVVYAMIGFLAVVVLSKCYLLPRHVNPIDENHIFHPAKKEGNNND